MGSITLGTARPREMVETLDLIVASTRTLSCCITRKRYECVLDTDGSGGPAPCSSSGTLDGQPAQGMKIQENASDFKLTQGGEVDQRQRNQKISAVYRNTIIEGVGKREGYREYPHVIGGKSEKRGERPGAQLVAEPAVLSL